MSREPRDWLGRSAPPIRERWRERWEGSSPATREGGHRSKGLPKDSASAAASGGSSGRLDGRQAAEARAGALFSQAVQREPLPQQRLVAIAGRLPSRSKRRRPAPRRLIVRLAAGLSLLVVGGALAATASHYFNFPIRFGRPSSGPVPSRPPGKLPHVSPVGPVGLLGAEPSGTHAGPVDLSLGVQRPAPVTRGGEDQAVASRSVSAWEHHHRPPRRASPSPSRAPRPEPSLPPEPTWQPPEPPGPTPLAPTPPPATPLAPSVVGAPPPPPPTALAEESALIMSALTALRRDDDAPRALAILDRHDLRFPRGDLADEATLARVEALVKVRRSGDALALLDARGPIRRGSSQRKLALTRAELRAGAGRCAAALDELDALLRGAPPADAVTERALWERAACRASGGQFDSARTDLEAYLRLFPSGQFARGARAALDGGGDGGGPRPPKP